MVTKEQRNKRPGDPSESLLLTSEKAVFCKNRIEGNAESSKNNERFGNKAPVCWFISLQLFSRFSKFEHLWNRRSKTSLFFLFFSFNFSCCLSWLGKYQELLLYRSKKTNGLFPHPPAKGFRAQQKLWDDNHPAGPELLMWWMAGDF